MNFYGAAAQVIPVLLLALIFESRMLVRSPSSYTDGEEDPSNWNATQIVARVYLMLVVVAGEAAALVGLYRQEANPLTNGLVWVGLGAALITLVASALSHQWGYWCQWWQTRAKATWWLQALMLVMLVLLTVWVIDWIA